jgi:hypothetical protein
MTALECRQTAARYLDEARTEHHTGIRTALLAINRSWMTIADQLERLAELREAEKPAS